MAGRYRPVEERGYRTSVSAPKERGTGALVLGYTVCCIALGFGIGFIVAFLWAANLAVSR